MILDTWNFGPLGGSVDGPWGTVILGILGLLIWVVRTLLQRRAMKKAKAPVKVEPPVEAEAPVEVETKVDYFRLLTLLLIVLAVIVAVLPLIVVSSLQTSLLAKAISIAACAVAAFTLITALMLGIGAPAVQSVITLKSELQVVKEQIREAWAHNRKLEGKVKELEARLLNGSSEQPILPSRKESRKVKSPRDKKKGAPDHVDDLKQIKAERDD